PLHRAQMRPGPARTERALVAGRQRRAAVAGQPGRRAGADRRGRSAARATVVRHSSGGRHSRRAAALVGVLVCARRRRMKPPAALTATYRLQFNGEFTFGDAAAVVPYLDALGISHVYASPCLKARAGSV